MREKSGGKNLCKELWRHGPDLIVHAQVNKGALTAVEAPQLQYWTTC